MRQKTVLVSGATGNLGQAVVHHFLKMGWQVIGLVHHLEMQGEHPANYSVYEVDLIDERASLLCLEKILKEFGQIDTLVLTAGGFAAGEVEDSPFSKVEQQLKLNFATAYNCVQPLFKRMKDWDSGGRLFFIGSKQGMDSRKGSGAVAYSLSKSLLFQLANIINADAGDKDIKAKVIVPSIIDTPQNREAMPSADFRKWQSPDAIAEIIGDYAEGKRNREPVEIVVESEI